MSEIINWGNMATSNFQSATTEAHQSNSFEIKNKKEDVEIDKTYAEEKWIRNEKGNGMKFSRTEEDPGWLEVYSRPGVEIGWKNMGRGEGDDLNWKRWT